MAKTDEYKYLTTYEEHLVRTFPTLTAEELEQVNDNFPHYCFLHKRGDGVEVSTSCCHVDKRFYPWLRELDTPEDRELLDRAHNEKGVCPYCGKPVTFKNARKCGKFKNISSTGAVVFWKAERGAVWAQAYWARKEYWPGNLTGKVSYQFDNGYVFMRGQAFQFCKDYQFWNAIWEEQKIGRCIRITDPFEYGWMFHDREHDWLDVGREAAVESSFLKYSGLDKFDHRWHCPHSTPFKFLTLYCVYPRAVEMLMKAGMMRVVSDFTDMRKKTRRQSSGTLKTRWTPSAYQSRSFGNFSQRSGILAFWNAINTAKSTG